MKPKSLPPLQRIIFRFLVNRQIVFSLVIALILIVASYLSGQNYLNQQWQATTLLAHRVSDFYDSASNVLTALADMSPTQKDLDAVQKTYTTFDTLYLIDKDGKLKGVSPSSQQMIYGMDMSGQSYFKPGVQGITTSKLFISPRTGNPTVYLSTTIENGDGMVVVELSLASLQDSITRTEIHQTGIFYIVDQDGILLAHPQYELVRRQENIRELGIIEGFQKGQAQQIYLENGQLVVGIGAPVSQMGWLAITQASLLTIYAPFFIPAVLGLFLTFILFVVVVRRERRDIAHLVVTPLSELSEDAQRIASGDYSTETTTSAHSATFAEISNLAGSFEQMRQTIIARDAALRENEERWQFGLSGAGDGVWDWNAVTNEVYYSRQYQEMLGYEDGELEGSYDAWEKLIHPDDMEKVLADYERYFDGKMPALNAEYRLRCKDGSYKWILDRGKIISRTPEGKPLRVLGTHADITGRKLIEEELLKNRDLLRKGELVAGFGNIELYLDENVIYASQGARRIYGLSGDHWTIAEVQSLALPEYRPVLDEALRALISNQKPYQQEYEYYLAFSE